MNRRVAVAIILAGASIAMGSGTSGAEDVKLAKATLAGGCFWCTEAQYKMLKGVSKVVSGYAGGQVDNPTYKQVCNGDTGHAEVILVEFDPKVITYRDLVDYFWIAHDPTTLNRQGADVGTQYRSGVFYHDDEQKRIAEEVIAKLDEAKVFPRKIVTEVTKATTFYPAEDYHQDYFANNPFQPYCQAVAAPKVDKVRKVFKDLLK